MWCFLVCSSICAFMVFAFLLLWLRAYLLEIFPRLLSLGRPSLPPSVHLESRTLCLNELQDLFQCQAVVVDAMIVLRLGTLTPRALVVRRMFPGSSLGFALRAAPKVPSGLLPPCLLLRDFPLQRRSGLRSVWLPRAAPPSMLTPSSRLVTMVVGTPAFLACCSCVGFSGWGALCSGTSYLVRTACVHGCPPRATISSEPPRCVQCFATVLSQVAAGQFCLKKEKRQGTRLSMVTDAPIKSRFALRVELQLLQQPRPIPAPCNIV